jgi:hypothetical protein
LRRLWARRTSGGGRLLFEKNTGIAHISTSENAGGPPSKTAVFSHNKTIPHYFKTLLTKWGIYEDAKRVFFPVN